MTSTTTQHNPFSEPTDATTSDEQLVADALEGQRDALENLVRRHQPWIYNLAFRMVMVPQEAEDITQEALIKVLTKLGSFDAKRGRFRTWLYRIVANHVINMKTRGYEAAITTFDRYYTFIAEIPDQEPDTSPETERTINDLTIACVMGTLLCLERRQRVVFILSVAFDVTPAMGAEILDITADNYRQILSRARAKLHQYMQGNCGVVNHTAPCRCRRKIKGFLESGAASHDNLVYLQDTSPAVRDLVGGTMERFDKEIYGEYARLFRQHPFYQAPEVTAWLQELVQRPSFRETFHL